MNGLKLTFALGAMSIALTFCQGETAWPSLVKGDIVLLASSESGVKQSFEDVVYEWNDQMKGMLGKKFPVLEILEGNIIALPSPDGSQDGKWYFPRSVVGKVKEDGDSRRKRSPGMTNEDCVDLAGKWDCKGEQNEFQGDASQEGCTVTVDIEGTRTEFTVSGTLVSDSFGNIIAAVNDAVTEILDIKTGLLVCKKEQDEVNDVLRIKREAEMNEDITSGADQCPCDETHDSCHQCLKSGGCTSPLWSFTIHPNGSTTCNCLCV